MTASCDVTCTAAGFGGAGFATDATGRRVETAVLTTARGAAFSHRCESHNAIPTIVHAAHPTLTVVENAFSRSNRSAIAPLPQGTPLRRSGRLFHPREGLRG